MEMAGEEMINGFEQEIENTQLRLKTDIKKTGGNFGRMLLILAISTYAIGLIIILIIQIKGRILGIDTTTNKELNIIFGISQDKYNFLVGYLPCMIADVIAIIIAIKTTKIKLKADIFTQNKSSKAFILLGTISCIGTGMISSIIYFVYSTIIKNYGIIIPEPDFSFPTQSIYLILFLIYVCLLGPILEEIIFRGFILKSMQKYGNLTAIIVSSILFSMFHLNLVQFVNPVIMGILLGFITIKSKSIVPSIIAHIFNNSMAFTAVGISLLKMPVVESIFSVTYFLVGTLALTLFIIKYGKEFFELIKENTIILKTYEKVRYSFSGLWALTYITFYVIFVAGFMILTNVIKS